MARDAPALLRLVYKRSGYRELIIEGARDPATRWSPVVPLMTDGTCVMPICNILEATCDIDYHRFSLPSTSHVSYCCAFSTFWCFLLSLQLWPLFLGLLWSAIQKSRRLQWPSHPRSQPCLDECGGATPRPVTVFARGSDDLDLSNGSGEKNSRTWMDLKLDLLDSWSSFIHLKSI